MLQCDNASLNTRMLGWGVTVRSSMCPPKIKNSEFKGHIEALYYMFSNKYSDY